MSARPASVTRTASPASWWLVLALLLGALWPDWALALRPPGVPITSLPCFTGITPVDGWAQGDEAGDDATTQVPRCSACLHVALSGPPTVEHDDLPRPMAVTLLAARGVECPRPDLGPIRHAARPRGPPVAG